MIAIIGSGNVATHLHKALRDHTQVTLVNPHTLEEFPDNPEVVIICVSDKAIGEVSRKLPKTEAIITHTAGSVPMEILAGNSPEYGVFYPLQTFTKGMDLDYSTIPVFIEGSSLEVVSRLKELASLFTRDVREADSQSRKILHLASVFACNFTNALAGISEEILKDSHIDFSAMLPLMKQTVNKLDYMSPRKAQTGPAVRGDSKVTEEHLKMLDNNPRLQTIYSDLTKYISGLS